MAHWSGTRSGWNTRGGTDAEYLRTAKEVAERNNPDSEWWQGATEIEQENLFAEIGEVDYRVWMEFQFPNIDDRTWREIYTAVVNFDSSDLECACTPEYVCAVCQARAKFNEIPY